MRYAMMVVAVAAGCSDGAPREPAGDLPGASPFERRAAGAAGRASDELACGYDQTQANAAGPGAPVQHYKFRGRYRYDGRGNQILDESFDEKGALYYHYVTEYNAMGQPARYVDSFAEGPDVTVLFTYDSFGRRVRIASDYDGDGADDRIISYAYASGDLPTTRSLRYPHATSAHQVSYDRTYHYDGLGRQTGYDQDSGPDGAIDQIAQIVYDQAARTRTTTVRDLAGATLNTIEESFDEFNDQLSWVQTTFDPVTGHRDVYDQELTYDGDGRLVRTSDVMTTPDDGPDFDSTTLTDFHYRGCR